MKVLKKRNTAIAITVLIVLLATLFGVHRSLKSAVNKIEDQFYNGVYLETEEYTQKSIYSQLGKRVDAALGLVTVASNYSELEAETETLRDTRLSLIDAESITDMYTANETMQIAFETLFGALMMQSDLTESNRISAESYASTFGGAKNVIEYSDYNFAVSEFISETMNQFPVNLLKNIVFVHNPEYFGLEG